MKQDTTHDLQQSQIKCTKKRVCCHFLHLFKRQIKHRTNPYKVQMEITLTQTYETIQTTTQQLSVMIDSKMKIMMNYNYLLTFIHRGKELYSTLSCKTDALFE